MSAHAKQTYRAKVKLEVFYSGGAVQLSPDGRHLACACGDEVKVCRSSCGCHKNARMGCARCAARKDDLPPGGSGSHVLMVAAQVVTLASGAVVHTLPGVSRPPKASTAVLCPVLTYWLTGGLGGSRKAATPTCHHCGGLARHMGYGRGDRSCIIRGKDEGRQSSSKLMLPARHTSVRLERGAFRQASPARGGGGGGPE